MIELILSILLFVYLGMAALFAVLLIFSTIKLGGFEEYAKAGNQMFGLDSHGGKRYTKDNIQWYMAALVIFWPVVFALFFLIKRNS